MTTNRRVYFAVQSVSVAQNGTTSYTAIHGLQSCNVETRFNVERIYEMGQSETYEAIEALPDLTVTIEKVLDGYPPIYTLVTKGATSASISGRANARSSVGLSIYPDTSDSASGTAVSQVIMSGMYVQSFTYNFPVQGNCTEQVVLVGNNKTWASSYTSPAFDNTDEPLADATLSGGVQQRQDVIMGDGDTSPDQPTVSIWPTHIPGITSSGTNPQQSDGSYSAHIQNVRVSANLGREQLFELGRRGPYYRYVQFPVDVTTDIELTSSQGDNVDALEESEQNTGNYRIFIRTREGTRVKLGTRNRLNSVTMGGAEAQQGGSNQSITLQYIGSTCEIYHPQDPMGF